jgi:hypothetical protein
MRNQARNRNTCIRIKYLCSHCMKDVRKVTKIMGGNNRLRKECQGNVRCICSEEGLILIYPLTPYSAIHLNWPSSYVYDHF